MQKETLRFFDNITKGSINIIDPNIIEWILGDMILIFYDNCGEQMIRICWKKRNRELIHIHIDDEDIEEFIKNVSDDKNVICVRNFILWNDFEIIDKSKIKKQTFFRHYSI